MMIVLAAAFALITWRVLKRTNPGHRR
jgi:hypothetical protein